MEGGLSIYSWLSGNIDYYVQHDDCVISKLVDRRPTIPAIATEV